MTVTRLRMRRLKQGAVAAVVSEPIEAAEGTLLEVPDTRRGAAAIGALGAKAVGSADCCGYGQRGKDNAPRI